jgi:hypothetical protein
VADSVRQNIEAERRNAKEALRNNQEFFAQDLQVQLLSQECRCEVRCCDHQQNQIFQPLVAHNPNVFKLITLFDEAKSFLMTLLVQHQALSGGADNKAFSPLQQRLQELSAVSAMAQMPRPRVCARS